VGIWVSGRSETEIVNYEAMIGNGYSTDGLSVAQINDQYAFAGSLWLEPWGPFGRDVTSLEPTESPLIRFGQSVVYSRQSGTPSGGILDESGFLRLADGTQLTEPGALSPGVTVDRFGLLLYSLDAAWKWKTLSIDAEYHLQWVDHIAADGQLPRDRFFQHGFLVEGGWFVVPETLDINARHSQIYGLGGTAAESAVGCNWYLSGQNARIAFDVTWLDGNAARSTGANLNPGDRGVLFRTELQLRF
jgi:hypothetical protein